ncbi:FliM/FliN family flagellar motor switch protein [Vagococcus sp. WN89Y]|uniref:FliM/FliN family flagellar motor switch protein n=1 Tax=Vagococcus sp. WN89Y TaxID=3457258 RepID=UPI003FCD5BB9
MSLRHHLRLINQEHTALEQLRLQHPESEIVEVKPEERYLQMHMSDEQGVETDAFINIDSWLQKMDMHLPGIPWQDVPLSYLARWLNNLQLSFLVEDIVWDVQGIALPSDHLPETLLQLPAQPSSLLCIDWPVSNEAMQQEGVSLTELPFNVRYVLGHSQLPLSVLAGVAIGDLLIIADYAPSINIGKRRLFSFNHIENQGVIVEESYRDEMDVYQPEEETLLEWTSLPVDIEYVLDSNTVTLAELEEIRPGVALPITAGAEHKIKIYLNRKLFALGELVALESGALAVEVNQINPGKVGESGYSDAEQ